MKKWEDKFEEAFPSIKAYWQWSKEHDYAGTHKNRICQYDVMKYCLDKKLVHKAIIKRRRHANDTAKTKLLDRQYLRGYLEALTHVKKDIKDIGVNI